jgi:hypothetical protein
MSGSETNRTETPRWPSLIFLLVLVGVALVLRWRYIQEISLFVDEFVTAWAARNVPSRGLPSFPSGNLYPHGFLFTYLVVPFVLGKFDETLVRIPGLIVSLATLPVGYWVGRRLFDERVGLIVAAALAVDPDCILWGGRARMYGLLQLLTLLAVYLFYRSLVTDRTRDRYLAMGLVVAAIFTHVEAAFLLPALALAMLVAWPWRRIFRWQVILPFALAAAGAGVFFLLAKFGQPGHLETLQESRPYLDFTADVLSGPRAFAPVFFSLYRLPFTLLAFAGLIFLVWPHFDRSSPLTYLYVVLAAVLVPLLVLAGATWQNERYLFMLLPLLYLIGGRTLTSLLDLVPALRRTLPWQPPILALLVALTVGLTGSQQAYKQEWGYDQAFRYLQERWAPEAGDRVVSVSPTACALYLGGCDYFAIQHGYEEFVVNRHGDNLPADLWTATPLMTSTADFVDLLSTAPGVWFVSDGWRFQTRYDADFIQAVLDQMELVYEGRGVMVFHNEGFALASQPALQLERRADFDEALALVGFGLSPEDPRPGDEIEITLYWQALEEAGVGYTAFLHLLGPDGTGVAGIDEPVLGGLYQPILWPREATFADRHRLTLPADLLPGRYRLDLGLYPPGQPDQALPVAGGDRLPLVTLAPGVSAPPPPITRADVDFGGEMRLQGYDLNCDPQSRSCSVQLHWQTLEAMDRDYTVFLHLVDDEGAIVVQDDAPPGDLFFPTSTWLPGTVVPDRHTLSVPEDALSSDYYLLVGLYYRPSGERLKATDADGHPLGDSLLLTTISPGAEGP